MDEAGRDERDQQRGGAAGSARSCAEALVACGEAIWAREAEQFALVAAWADLHGAPDDPEVVRDRLGDGVLPTSGLPGGVPGDLGRERLRRAGGLGTPQVVEFAAAELGVLLGTSTASAALWIADAVDVRHRLPSWWAAVHEHKVRVWQARKVARLTRAAGLSLEQARWVDAQVAPWLASLPWARLVALVEAKIIAVDPGAAQERRRAAEAERFVATGRVNEHGLRTVIVKALAGDAVWFVSMCDRIAACLAAEGDEDPVEVRRSRAVGILANPAGALVLLARHAVGAGAEGSAEGPDDAGDGTGEPGGSVEQRRDVQQRDGAGAEESATGPHVGDSAGAGTAGGEGSREASGADGCDDPDRADACSSRTGEGAGSGDTPGVPASEAGTGGHLAQAVRDAAHVDPWWVLEALERADVEDPPQPGAGPPDGESPGESSAPVEGSVPAGMSPVQWERLLASLAAGGVDPARLLPKAVLYVHVSAESLHAATTTTRDDDGDGDGDERAVPGVARVEGLGPVTLGQVRDWLGHVQVTVRPVIDLAADHPVDGYEVPDRMREQLLLRSPATVFPYTPSLSRRADLDHTVPYRPPGKGREPGQTRIGNLGRLLRLHHRVKTHGKGWVHRQPEPGVHYWRTPTGYWTRVDNAGTHWLGRTLPKGLAGDPTVACTAGSSTLEARFAEIIAAA